MTQHPTSNKYLNRPVFYWSSCIILLMVVIPSFYPAKTGELFKALLNGIIATTGWYYVLAVAVIFLSVIYFAMSRFGDIRLGPDHSSPDYHYASWFAMLFSAGMGIGLMFFGVAEPVMHFVSPPKGESATLSAAREAMKLTFFHWGLHAWAIYAVVGLILAYFSFRHRLPLTLRSALYPLIGDRIYGPIGHAIDIFAIIGTVLGVATSLGYGAAQINAGMFHLFGITESQSVQLVVIVVVAGFALVSIMSGLDRGIRRLSEINLVLAVSLLSLILLIGPTLFLIQSYVQNTGSYLSELVGKTFNLYAYDPTDWLGGWTIFYWGWWISWSPFVGIFIARISRGRTIREFCLGVMMVPAGFTFLWMTIFGNSAIDIIMNQGQASLATAVEENNAIALFQFLEYFPLSSVLSGLAIVMVVVFFVTSADSGALVVNMLASGGHDNTPIWQRAYWTGLIALVASVLLVAGGLGALQSLTIASALPFSFMLLWAIFGLIRALNVEALKKASLLDSMNTTPLLNTSGAGDDWKLRIDNLANLPPKSHVRDFIKSIVAPGMKAVASELQKKDYDVAIEQSKDRIDLKISHGDEEDFTYGVRVWRSETPSFATPDGSEQDSDQYYRAEVFLKEGSQNYDVMGYTREQLINDVLDQYEKHLHFLALLR